MISNVKNGTLNDIYETNSLSNSNTEKVTTLSKQGDTTKVDKIKTALDNGEYKVDLKMLSELIADELV